VRGLRELAKSGALDAELALVFDASPNPYMLLTPDLRYAGMNQAYLDVVGATREQLVGRPIFDIYASDPTPQGQENQRQLRASFEKVVATGRPDHLALIRYAMPATGPDGEPTLEERFWSATHTPIHDASGQIAWILQHTNDVTELVTLRRRVAGEAADPGEGTDTLLEALGGDVLRRAQRVQADNQRLATERDRLVELFEQAPGFIAVLRGPDHVFELANAAYARLIGQDRPLVGLCVRRALPEVAEQGFIDLLDQVYRTGRRHEGRNTEVALRRGSRGELERLYVDFVFQPVREARGETVGILVQGHEVTDAVLAAQRQRLMIDELNHRVKNTLATVQSIAVQTARSHEDPRSFAETFQARLLALSHTHDLLTHSHWEGAALREVLTHETEAHGPSRILLEGPPVDLPPASALSLGMVFHELATNAAKYGALSSPEGRVFVDWSLSDETDARLEIVWRERGGPAVKPPVRRGFGARLIEGNVRHDLAGQLKVRYEPDGLEAMISIPFQREPAV
jgi:two-component sensor histidine kinase